ncbi:hypothetical protein EMCRGX_G031166 [Ephydatia muelleri]
MKRADTEFSAARRQFVTTKADNKSLNDDAMLVITSSDEKSSLMSEGDAPTERDTHAARTIGLRTLERLRSRADLLVLSNDELELKTNMFYHISNPLARWKADRSPPIKMILQLLKTFCIVTQAVLFMQSLTGEQSIFENDAQTVFAKFLLPNSSPAPPLASRTTPYNTYDYTAYTVTELEEILNTACDNFYNSTGTLFGGYGLEYVNGSIRPIQVVLTQYVEAELNASDRSFVLNGVLNTTSFEIKPEAGDGRSSFQQFLDNCGPDNCFQRFVKMDMYFYAMNIKILTASLAQCYAVTVTLSFVVTGGGKLQYTLVVDLSCVQCTSARVLNSSDNLAVTTGCAEVLPAGKGHGYVLPHQAEDQAELIVLDLHYPCSSRTIDVDSVRIMLGVSVVLQAAVILRYVSYFRQFNALSSALDIAIPRLVKFFLCAGILFVAFMLCAWVVLGPFHYKFQTFDGTFYALFTMLNGDDLWNTYTGITSLDDNGVYVFSQIFFTIFLMLFIYAVLNLFISLIIESYEYSQRQDPFIKDEVHRFVFSGPLTPGGVALRDLSITKHYVDPELIKCCSDDKRIT